MADLVTLTVDGQTYGGWKAVSITRGLEIIAGTFELEITERWPQPPERRRIAVGAPCSVSIGSDVVITGYVDDVEPRYDARSHTVAVTGRDATGDLVDCSAVHRPGQWDEKTFAELAAILCQPFGIRVAAEIETGKPFSYKLQPGDTVFAELDRMSRHAGVMMISDGRGGLVLTRAGKAGRVPDRLELGRNILAAKGEYSHRDRYSEIFVLGQRQGFEEVDAGYTAEGEGHAVDPGVSRYRPLVVLAERSDDDDGLAKRADWEARHRAGQARRVSVTVQGWRHAGGDLWRPNTLVPLSDDFLGVNEELLVVETEFTLDDEGSKTTLTLCPQAAFELIPFPDKELGW